MTPKQFLAAFIIASPVLALIVSGLVYATVPTLIVFGACAFCCLYAWAWDNIPS